MAEEAHSNIGDETDEAPHGYLVEALANRHHFNLMAQFSKRHYDALVAAGFTPDQAIKIVAHGTPMTMMTI